MIASTSAKQQDKRSGTERPCVYLIEDDDQVAKTLGWMLLGANVETLSFSLPSLLLQQHPPDRVACLVIDLNLPEMSGIELIKELRTKGWVQPFLVITGDGKIPDAVAAMRQGAIDFLQKPLTKEVFVESVLRAIERDVLRAADDAKKHSIIQRMNRLTPRERQVLDLVVEGKLNKQIASELCVSIKTVEAHRSNLTRKLKVDSIAQLIRFVLEARN